MLLELLAGFVNREQAKVLDYLREENRVLREMLGGRRLRFTDRQRKRLAIRGKALGRALLRGVAILLQPDTISAGIAGSSPRSGRTQAEPTGTPTR